MFPEEVLTREYDADDKQMYELSEGLPKGCIERFIEMLKKD